MIEPFRPWIDRLLLEQVFTEKIDASFFEHKEKGLWLNKEGKRFIIPLFNDLMAAGKRFDTKNLSCKNHIHRYAGLFAQALLKP